MRPAVFTFYSYKGGVGRTILAANMALALARKGKTLLWDLDAEAPGLHRIRALRNAGGVKNGFFDWLIQWQAQKNIPPQAAELAQFANLLHTTPFTNYSILAAHGDKAHGPDLYYQIDWHGLLLEAPTLGRDLLNALIDHLGELGFRHIIIDSRTGLSDLGGLLAGAIPDATVLVGGYGPQNLHGLGQISAALAQDNGEQRRLRARNATLKRYYVASPIPQDDPKLVAAGREIWAEAFKLELASVHEIRYDPDLPFSEALLITQPERAIAKDYERFAAELIRFADQLHETEMKQQQQISARPDIFGLTPNSGITERSFTEQVAILLRLLGYTVSENQTIGRAEIDLVAHIESGLDSTTYLVECSDSRHSLPLSKVEQLRTWLDLPEARAMQARGMVVARSLSPIVATWAKDHGIQAMTLLDMERRLLDFGPHLKKIIEIFEQSPLARAYVTQHAYTQDCFTRDEDDFTDHTGDKAASTDIKDLLQYGLAWANGVGKPLWILLGDYGIGKTAFTQKLEYELAKLAKADSSRIVPLRINLRDVPNKVTMEELLTEAWLRATGQRKDPRILEYLIERGRIVLLLDSFDEMGLATSGRSTVEQFRNLVQLAGKTGPTALSNRLLLTCREQFFKDHGEATRTMSGYNDEIVAQSALQGLALGFDGSIDTVAMLTPKQVEEFLKKRLGDQNGGDALRFLQKRNLLQLGDRPQLLDIIIQSLPKLKEQEAASGQELSTGALYQIYTDKWLEDSKPVERQSSSEQLRNILEVLAQELWQRADNRIHYGDLYLLVKNRGDLRGKLDPKQLDIELRTAAFLSRTPDGFYGFSHRSFLEFFLAHHILHAALAFQNGGQISAINQAFNIPRLSNEVCDFIDNLTTLPPAKSGESKTIHPARLALQYTTQTLLSVSATPPASSRANALLLASRLS
jgi:NACHT domain/CobQ/CobB/MinD/ParA nucleotide binding domain/Restriction endonuclease